MENKRRQIVRGHGELWEKPTSNFEPKEENLPEEQPGDSKPDSE